MKNGMEFPQRVKNETTIWSSNSTSECLSVENNNTKRCLCPYVHCLEQPRHGNKPSAHQQKNQVPVVCVYIYTYICAYNTVAAAAKSLQSRPTLCDPIDGSPPGSPVPGILQARTLEWVAVSFSNAGKWKVKVKSLSCVRLLATPWTAAYQALHPWDFPGKSTGVGCHCLLRYIYIHIYTHTTESLLFSRN